MNMTEKFEHDQKIHTNEHYPLNLTKNNTYYQNDEHERVYVTDNKSIFRSCSMVKIPSCNLSVKFQRFRLSV